FRGYFQRIKNKCFIDKAYIFRNNGCCFFRGVPYTRRSIFVSNKKCFNKFSPPPGQPVMRDNAIAWIIRPELIRRIKYFSPGVTLKRHRKSMSPYSSRNFALYHCFYNSVSPGEMYYLNKGVETEPIKTVRQNDIMYRSIPR